MGILPPILKKKIIIREYYEWLYANMLDNLDEAGKFLETHNHQNWLMKKEKNLDRPKTS